MRNLENKIEAKDVNVNELMKNQKFFIDYFQREYRWQEKHIKSLVEDLATTFLKSFDPSHSRQEVANYQSYYLGPIVFSVNSESGKKSIIDGQQRITSLTLFLIFLNHLQKGKDSEINISELIFSESYGVKSFNMTDLLREPCLKALFENGDYCVLKEDDETVHNMLERYTDISLCFPDELLGETLPYFIDWLIRNVVIVEIKAYSDENAYTIFETMNDRGLNLTSTEMLKGYVLSKISSDLHRVEINNLWKIQIKRLREYGEITDQIFFQAWFRGKYAKSIRPGNAGSENQDFELIGSQFHNWFKDNHKELLNLNTENDLYKFFSDDFPFYVEWYTKILDSKLSLNSQMPHVYYANCWGIADSLQEPMLLASVIKTDNEETIVKKIDYVSRFIETFSVRRAVNYKKFGQTSIKYTMFNLIKLFRNNKLDLLRENLISETNSIEQKWDGVWDFGLHGQNRKFVKHLLSRISSYIDWLIGKDNDYVYYHQPKGKQFEIEHIWSDKFEDHKDEFEQEGEFDSWRNSIGALILLPNGTNQSFSSDEYEDKIDHYLKENTFAQSLHYLYYKKNPNFLLSDVIKELQFKSHSEFKTQDISDRQKLVQRICEKIWETEYYEN